MPGLVPGTTSFFFAAPKTWMAGTSPAMTKVDPFVDWYSSTAEVLMRKRLVLDRRFFFCVFANSSQQGALSANSGDQKLRVGIKSMRLSRLSVAVVALLATVA